MRPAQSNVCLAAGIVILSAAILIGPFFSHPDYSTMRHTTSELAGQSMPHAWIMRVGFLGYGLSVAVTGLAVRRMRPLCGLCLVAFGAGLIGTAIWSANPIDLSLAHDPHEDFLHSIFSGVVGAAFACACATDILEHRGKAGRGLRPLSWLGLAASVLFPLAMVSAEMAAGLFQRVMFAISMVWFWVRFGDLRCRAVC